MAMMLRGREGVLPKHFVTWREKERARKVLGVLYILRDNTNFGIASSQTVEITGSISSRRAANL